MAEGEIELAIMKSHIHISVIIHHLAVAWRIIKTITEH